MIFGWALMSRGKQIRYTSGADDRHTCMECGNLRGGVCSVARPGGVVSAVVGWRPALAGTVQRCRGFAKQQ